MSTLGQLQELFMRYVHKLQSKAYELGYEVRGGELERPQLMQEHYYKIGRSKTLNGQHGKKLAIDLHFTKDGKLCYPPELGVYWESLDPRCRWGGSWRGSIQSGKSSFKDLPHFELNA